MPLNRRFERRIKGSATEVVASRFELNHRVIDRMRQGSIVGSVGLLHGPGRQRSHASAGQPDRPEDENQLGADNESSWAVLPENVPEDPADEPDVLY